MARQGRPASESYQSVCYSGSPSVSLSSGSEIVGLDDEDDQAPIFSLSKSSMDVVMASGLPHKRDPAWARTDLRRSSSTNTHSEQNSVTLQQLHPQMWQHINAANSQQLCLSTQNVDMHSPPVLSERWITNMQRWSGCSTQSRSSTPDTIVWKEGNSCPSGLTQETACSAVIESPVFKPMSSPTTPSAFTSPLLTQTLAISSSSLLSAHQQKDVPETLLTSTSSPLPPNSPNLHYLTSTQDERSLENSMLAFTFPSPVPSYVSISEEGGAPSDAGSFVDDVIETLRSPGATQSLECGGVRSPVQVLSHLRHDSCLSSGLRSPGSSRLSDGGEMRSPMQTGYLLPNSCPPSEAQSPRGTLLSEGEEMRSPMQRFGHPTPDSCSSPELQSPGGTQFSFPKPISPMERQESGSGTLVCHLELPCPPAESLSPGQSRRLPLVYSLSDSQLGESCRCSSNLREGITNAPKVNVFRRGGAMTPNLGMVDAAVQTVFPLSSFWGMRNTSNSNMGSHSLLGSPPGSRLNLKSSVGSNSNLVSPSSSMFPVSSEEEGEGHEDDPTWETDSPMHNPERRRSCLKIQGEIRDKLRRRSSMKQVQWDEEGMTWDIHGASVDPVVLSTAIQKHLDLKNSPQPAKSPSKKKRRAPKPPLISNVVKAMTPELNPPGLIISSACMVEPESEDPPETEKEGRVLGKGSGTKEDSTEIVRRASKAEAFDGEEEEGCGEDSSSHAKSPTHGNGQGRKKSVIRSLRPGWCGGSRKVDD
ncbi:mucin-12 [Xyrichtys novacula]|uniref:Mucin-12 n=1 Tax=Xyrichtys novacula TaxID=13765 RepID=A0AAV1H257_XYRNO|nr:mucin-12 [Xyrichtys novacula]